MGKKVSNKGRGSYATYQAEGRRDKNRTARLLKHLKAYPEDTAAAKALKKAKPVRKASRKKGNFPDQKFYTTDSAGHKFLIPEFDAIPPKKIGK